METFVTELFVTDFSALSLAFARYYVFARISFRRIYRTESYEGSVPRIFQVTVSNRGSSAGSTTKKNILNAAREVYRGC